MLRVAGLKCRVRSNSAKPSMPGKRRSVIKRSMGISNSRFSASSADPQISA